MAIENTLEVRLLHAAKTLSEWNQVENAPKAGEVCLEKQSTTPPITYKIKIGDNSTHYANLPYFGTVVTASGNAQVVEFYTYPDNYSDISLRNVTVMRIYELNLSYSSGSGSGETAVNLSVDTTTFKEIRPGSNISFTSSNSGALLTIAANMDFSSLDVTEYAQVEWDSTNNQINIYGIKEVDGKISRGVSFKSLKVSSPLTISNTNNIITFGIQNATTQQKGAVRLLDTYTSSNASDNTFATTNASITSAIENLDSIATTPNTDNSKDVIVTVTESNGIVSSTKKTVTEGDKITISTPTTGADAGKMIISHEESNTVVTDNSSNKNERETNIITDVTVDDYGHVTAYTKDKSTNLIAADIRASVTKTDDTTWNYRETGGEISIGEDIARVSKLKGNTIVWNQIIKNSWYFDVYTGGIRFASVRTSQSLITTTVTTAGRFACRYKGDETFNTFIQNGHRVYESLTLTIPVTTDVSFYVGAQSVRATKTVSANTPTKLTSISTVNNGSSAYTPCVILGQDASQYYLQVGDIFTVENFKYIDLTQLFGSDANICKALGLPENSDLTNSSIINTACDNFEKLFPNLYYPYCEGRLVNLGGYGVKWNQLVQNGNFVNSTGWNRVSGGNISISNGVATATKSATDSATYCGLRHSVLYTNSHKYLILSYVKSNNSATTIRIGIDNTKFTQYAYYPEWTRLSYVFTHDNDASNVEFRAYNGTDSSVEVNASFKNVMCFDLTEMFGPGSEPTLEEFEAMFPDEYYEYNEGTEMNIFDAAAGDNKLGLESVGFNQWDEEWENGSIVSTTGMDSDSDVSIRSKNYYKIIPNTIYYISYPPSGSVYIYYYDSNKNYLGYEAKKNANLSPILGAAYLRMRVGNTNNPVTTYNNNICLSIYDESRTDTYEPYKSSTLDLDWVRNEGVENFNVWDEEWEQGGFNSSGQETNYTSRIRSKNYIPVRLDKAYYFNITNTEYRVVYYDKNLNVLGTSYKSTPDTISPNHFSNTAYLRFGTADAYGGTYKNDICVNISNAALNGEYHPHGEKAKYFPQGLLSAGSVYDEVGENYAIKRVGAVDMGSMNWTKHTVEGTGYVFVSTGIANTKNLLSNAYIFNNDYGITNNNSAVAKLNNKEITYRHGDTNDRIYVKDLSHETSPTSSDNWLSGVMLYYELATPVVVYFDEKKKLTYLVNDHGTEQQLPVNGLSVITSPFVGTFEYKSNFKDAVIDLINKANAYKNPVKSKDNTNQTVDKFAIYDSAETVKSSEYAISDSETPFIGEGTEFILPTAKQVVDYVTTVLSSTLTYKGVLLGLHKGSDTKQFYIDEVIDALNPHVLIPSVGDMYVVSTQFSVSNNEGLPYGNIANGTYNAGDFFIWNNGDSTASPAIPAHWDIVSGTTSVAPNNPTLKPDNGQTAHEYTVATVDGTPIKVKVPGLYTNPNDVAKKVVTGISFDNNDYLTIQKTDLSTSDLTDKPALGNVFIGTGNSTSPEWNYLSVEKLNEINNILSSSDSSILKTGFLSRKSSGTTPATYSWEFANPLTSVSQLNIKTTSNDPLFSFDPSSQSNTDLRITSVDSSDASNANMYSNTNKAGIKITNGSNTTTQRISFSAIADDANVTIILDGNFS